MIKVWQVPQLWPGGTVVCIGGGPSLTKKDVIYAASRCDGVIGINDAYRLGVHLDLIYAADYKWWNYHWKAVIELHPNAPKVTVMREASRNYPWLKLLKCVQLSGWSDKQDTLHAGGHSGYQVINLAILAGASRILLLGYDMQGTHWFGAHPDNSRQDFPIWKEDMNGTYRQAQERGVEIINVSRETSLEEYPRMHLEDVLA